ncbi:hypothetical protein DICPUDRAFT_87921 [Dictyostelium purpureum]|uniref:T4 RNA ligase 1-like N-terminal domain-containing protein n=1 Tax=Dictyostelium purpureum TaxID=5786 RepID=F0ZL97_DICPU|nr:uncharacterized protein DICPUDRAFT_87921 [Dictyostelium purpureum]EGC35263.1 hypothetical protein DICPUDRAFT_87921 [Dictyostelium purpureum]|eukprot:XP_003288189.1 hypothetical protein DICPUDRAFT_87921 [Dictyostelium purpureum]
MEETEIDYIIKNKSIFPVGLTVQECREAIKGATGFRESIRGDTIVFNYDSISDESFPDPASELDPKKSYYLKIRRECRGLIFCKKTEKLLVRKLHKFFNINEYRECKADLVKLDGEYILMDKIDGSLISPMLIDNEGSVMGIYWGSKQGISDLGTMLNDFIVRVESNQSNQIKYNEFSKKWLENGYSPLFEFSSPKQPIIIHYKEEVLRLIAMRNIHTGEYLRWVDLKKAADEFNIPMVDLIDMKKDSKFESVKKTEDLVEVVKGLKYIEGCVLKFEDTGLMYKIKTSQYIDLSRLHLRSPKDIKCEKDVWSLLLSGHYDDVKDTISFICGDNEEPNEKIKRIKTFSKELFDRIDKVSIEMIEHILKAKKNNIPKKQYHTTEESSGLTKKAFSLTYNFFEAIQAEDSVQKHISLVSKSVIKRLKDSTTNNAKLEEGRLILGKDIKF